MSDRLPPEAFAAALAALPRMTARRLRLLLDAGGGPVGAHAIVSGSAATDVPPWLRDDPELRGCWRAAASGSSVESMWRRCVDLDIRAHVVRSQPALAALAHDIDPPAVLFSRGELGTTAGRRVALVGTRNATADARRVAFELGRDLAAAGVHVVSGLARGIDGFAHRGALAADAASAGPIGVVASGLDVVYPREHRDLWSAVGERGLLVSEAPPGAAPEPHRFPLRNRILAGLSEIVVVVESRSRGGSLITVDAALDRQIPVMAVPGSLRNPAAEGTNALLRDGAPAVLDADDIVIALGLDNRRSSPPVDPRPPLTDDDRRLLACCTDGGRTLDQLVLLTSRPISDLAIAVSRLEREGWLADMNGWFECLGPPR